MDDIGYVLELIYDVSGIEGGQISIDGTIIYKSMTRQTDMMERIWEKIYASQKFGLEKNILFFHEDFAGIYYWLLTDAAQGYYIFGPFCLATLSKVQIIQYCRYYDMKRESIVVPKLDNTIGMIRLSMWLVLGLKYSDEQILAAMGFADVMKVKRQDEVDYQIYRYEEDKLQSAYEYERKWMELIEYGRIDELRKQRTEQTAKIMLEHMGTMSKEDGFKQMEYMAVSSVATITRVAIRGGLPSHACLELSDLYLQKIASCKKEPDFLLITDQAAMDFCQRVHENRERKKSSVMVEQVKDYIARHLYRPFTVTKMADELAYNRTYLSRSFSEQEGVSIKRYILNERLGASANLLKYSDKDIGQIAEYMQFSSAGRFSMYFRERYGISPSEYREQNKLSEFVLLKSKEQNVY